MKRKPFFCCLCLCLFMLFSALLSACGTIVPEQSSEPAESSEPVPAAEDENVRLARAYLDELLMKEWEAGSDRFETVFEAVEWIPPEQVEDIRDCVKQLRTPILTEEDVLRIAEQALTVATLLWKGLRTLELPDCGVMAGIVYSPQLSSRSFEDCYRALLGYTLYLFTPPDYLFREDEVQDRVATASALWLYLPLAGKYTSRAEALSLLRQGNNGVELFLYSLAEGDHPLNFYLCATPALLRGEKESLSLDLYDLAMKGIGDAKPSEEFRILYAEAYVRKWIGRISSGFVVPSFSSFAPLGGTYEYYQCPDGTWVLVNQLISPEEARELREAVELLSVPVLTEETVASLATNLFLHLDLNYPVLLPGIDGREDTLAGPVKSDPAVLAHWVAAYFIDLLTPSAYRFEPLLGFGIGYALRITGEDYETPEEAMEVFSEGRARFVWVNDGVPYFIDRDGAVEPPSERPLDSTAF